MRRKLTFRKSQYVGELREALGLSQQDPCLTVLNAGASIWPVATVDLVVHSPPFLPSH